MAELFKVLKAEKNQLEQLTDFLGNVSTPKTFSTVSAINKILNRGDKDYPVLTVKRPVAGASLGQKKESYVIPDGKGGLYQIPVVAKDANDITHYGPDDIQKEGPLTAAKRFLHEEGVKGY